MLKQEKMLKDLQAQVGKSLAIVPLTPNAWTLISVLVAFLGAAIIVSGYLGIGLFFFVISAALDMVDGAVARARGQATALGGFLDGVSDRFVEAAFLFSLMFVPLPFIFIDPRIWIAMVLFLGTSMPSFIRAYADHKGVISRENALALGGICERSERIIIIVLGVAAGLLLSMNFLVYSLIAVSVLSLATVLQRLDKIIMYSAK